MFMEVVFNWLVLPAVFLLWPGVVKLKCRVDIELLVLAVIVPIKFCDDPRNEIDEFGACCWNICRNDCDRDCDFEQKEEEGVIFDVVVEDPDTSTDGIETTGVVVVVVVDMAVIMEVVVIVAFLVTF